MILGSDPGGVSLKPRSLCFPHYLNHSAIHWSCLETRTTRADLSYAITKEIFSAACGCISLPRQNNGEARRALQHAWDPSLSLRSIQAHTHTTGTAQLDSAAFSLGSWNDGKVTHSGYTHPRQGHYVSMGTQQLLCWHPSTCGHAAGWNWYRAARAECRNLFQELCEHMISLNQWPNCILTRPGFS